MHNLKITNFLPAIRGLPIQRTLTKQDLLINQLLLEKDGELEMYYSPHNEYINRKAKIVIVGITPGWNQMKKAFSHFLKSLNSGDPLQEGFKKSKKAAAFTGTMRNNLIDMFEQCQIADALHIPFVTDLFGESWNLLHTTSIIKYPVFFNGKNYTGHRPAIDHSPLLKHYAYEAFPDELNQIDPPALSHWEKQLIKL